MKRAFVLGAFVIAAYGVGWLAVCGCGTASAQDQSRSEPTVDELVKGVIARSEAVLSGRLEYDFLQGLPNQKPPIHPKRKLSFFGTSWADRGNGLQGRDEVSHQGKCIVHYRTLYPNGFVAHLLEVYPERPINSDGTILPVFAGTFWEQVTKKYVEAEAARAVLKGKRVVNGVNTLVLEWAVPKKDAFRAFQNCNGITVDGGSLRLFVAPQLGYVLPRLEHVGADGVVGSRYDCTDFTKVADGIYFPKVCHWNNLDRAGQPIYYMEFQIKHVEKINEPIPEEDFIEFVPVGARVSDNRPGTKLPVFDIVAEGSPPGEKLDDVIWAGTPSTWRRHRAVAIAIGCVLGFLVTLGGAFFIHHRRRRMKP